MSHSVVQEKALGLLRSLQSNNRESIEANPWDILAPRPDDYIKVFNSKVITIARNGYEQIWQESPYPDAKLNQTNILVNAATVEEIAAGEGEGLFFPGGYRKITPYLVPERVWVAWKYTEPNEISGMAYDGLVWMGEDRFVWFPKPWKVLSPLL